MVKRGFEGETLNENDLLRGRSIPHRAEKLTVSDARLAQIDAPVSAGYTLAALDKLWRDHVKSCDPFPIDGSHEQIELAINEFLIFGCLVIYKLLAHSINGLHGCFLL